MVRIIIAGSNYESMWALSRQAGWNQTGQDLAMLTASHPSSNILAISTNDSTHVGSGLVINAGASLAWIGMILVDHRFRRQGIATALMKQCMHLARSEMKNTVVGLDATAAGLQVYKTLGFEPSFRIWRCIVPTNVDFYNNSSSTTIVASDVSECECFIKRIRLDSKMTGFKLIRQLFPEGQWVAKNRTEVKGLVMTRPGRLKPFVGPLLADSVNTAKSLLCQALAFWNDQGYNEVFMDIPEFHFHSASTWKQERNMAPPSGCTLTDQIDISRCLVRMYELISGSNAYTSTLGHMEQERESLRYLYATGGPELG